MNVVKPVRFAQLDKAGYIHCAIGHSLRLSDAVPNGKEYDTQKHEHDYEDVQPFGLDLRLHDAKRQAQLPAQYALVFNR
jgi:hypothetical protein